MSTLRIFPLFNLPRELRDDIYSYYFQESHGYIHTPQPNKLRCFNGQPIDLALRYTRKAIAEETRDLPLKVNTITFRTGTPNSEQEAACSVWSSAGRYDFLLERVLFTRE
jgi:hypothetical protein